VVLVRKEAVNLVVAQVAEVLVAEVILVHQPKPLVVAEVGQAQAAAVAAIVTMVAMALAVAVLLV
jgi:hypothetical protein